MAVAFDNTFLTLLVDPTAEVRTNPETKVPTPHIEGKINSLLDELTERREVLIIPTPALAEVLCRVQPSDQVLERLRSYRCIELYSFDQKCAVTLAETLFTHRPELKNAAKEHGATRQKVKVDMQIVAVAATYGAEVLYTDDDAQSAFADLCGLRVLHTWDLKLSGQHAQIEIQFPQDASDGQATG